RGSRRERRSRAARRERVWRTGHWTFRSPRGFRWGNRRARRVAVTRANSLAAPPRTKCQVGVLPFGTIPKMASPYVTWRHSLVPLGLTSGHGSRARGVARPSDRSPAQWAHLVHALRRHRGWVRSARFALGGPRAGLVRRVWRWAAAEAGLA